MIILALDTSTSGCSAALWQDGIILARRGALMERGQSEALMPMVIAVMAEAELDFAALDLVAVTVGPGAFTGIRIGLATARAIGLAADIPVAGVTTTEAIAHAVTAEERRGRPLLVAVDARRADVFVQLFPADEPAAPPVARLPAAAAELGGGALLLAGDGATRLAALMPQAQLSAASPAPDAAVVADLAARHWKDGRALPPTPLYLRPPDVTLPPTGRSP